MVRVRMPMLTLMRAAALCPLAWAPMASSAVWAAWLMRRYSRFWRSISSFSCWSRVRPIISSSVFLPISVFCTISCSMASLSVVRSLMAITPCVRKIPGAGVPPPLRE